MTVERYKLPKDWVWTKFRTICKINPKHPKDIVSANTPVSFVPMSSIDAEKGEIIDPQTRPFGEVRKGYTHFANGDVLFAKITPCMENGKAAIAKDLHNGVGCGTTELHILRPLGSILSELIFYYIRQINFRRRAEANMSGTAGHLRVPVDFIGESDFPLSSFPEQKRIAQKIEILLGHLNKTRQELAKIPPLIKKFRQSVLAKAFSGELTNEWRDQQENLEPTSVLLDRICRERKEMFSKKHRKPKAVDISNLPELPEGWVYASLPCIAANEKNSIKRGPFGSAIKKVYFVSSGYKVYEQKNAIYNDFSLGNYYIDEKKFNKLKDFEVRTGDLIISCSGTIGRIAAVPKNAEKGIINQALLKISLDKDIASTEYFINLFSSYIFQSEILSKTRGSAMLNISSVKAWKQILFPMPSLKEQEKIVEKIKELFTRADGIEKAVQAVQAHSEKLTQSIFAKAFRGELVEHDPEDEPASILLKKIKTEKSRRSLREYLD